MFIQVLNKYYSSIHFLLKKKVYYCHLKTLLCCPIPHFINLEERKLEMLADAYENYPGLLFSKSNHALEKAF